MGWWMLVASALCTASPIVLATRLRRVEVEPDLFAIRYVGLAGGRNLVETLPVTQGDRRGGEWIDAGGLVTVVLPGEGEEGLLRLGPSEILNITERSVVLLGPESPEGGLRLRKELVLEEGELRARFTTVLLSSKVEPSTARIRNTLRLPQNCVLRIHHRGGIIRSLLGAPMPQSVNAISTDCTAVTIPPRSHTEKALLGALASDVEIVSGGVKWTRRLLEETGQSEVADATTCICVLDDMTRTYAVSLQGAESSVQAGISLTLTEEWAISAVAKVADSPAKE